MTRLHEQIETPLATDVAFAYVADFANSMHWDPGVATSEQIGSGPVGVGTRYRLGIRMFSRVAPMEYRITVFEPSSRVVLTGEGSGVSAVDDIRFEGRGTGTRIDYTADIRLGGVLRLLQPFLGGALRKIGENGVRGMQATLDRLAAEHAGAGTAPGQAPVDPATSPR